MKSEKVSSEYFQKVEPGNPTIIAIKKWPYKEKSKAKMLKVEHQDKWIAK